MNKAAFDKALDGTPLHVPVFILTTVPEWLSTFANKGDEFFYIGETFAHRTDGKRYKLGVSHVRFSHYAEFTIGNVRINRGF